ncbi:MAG: hypothetical protein J7L37_01630 [Thermococcus sp.]|nr:hypothetical protein [Thermococcus sp.]
MAKINLSTITALIFSFAFFPFMYWEKNLTFIMIYLLVTLSIMGYLTATGITTKAKIDNPRKLQGYSILVIYALTIYSAVCNDVFYIQTIPLFIGMMWGIITTYTSPRFKEIYSLPSKYLTILLVTLCMTAFFLITQSSGNLPSSSLVGAFMIGTIWVATNEFVKNKKEAALYFLLAIYAYFMGYYLSKYGNTLEIIIGGLILAGFLFLFLRDEFFDTGVQIFAVGFLFHIHQIAPILITREFQVLALQIIVGSVLKVTLWAVLTVLTTRAIIKITKSRKIRITSCLNFYPLAYWGIVAILIKAIPYFINAYPLWITHVLLDIGTLTAWGLSYYFLAKNLKKELKDTRTAIVSALISGITNFVLLPPPL